MPADRPRASRLAALAALAALPLVALAATAPPAAAQQPLGSAMSNVSGLELDLLAVERKGTILTVKWAVRNTGEDQQNYVAAYTGKAVTTYVLDEENGTKYYVLTDKEGNSVASAHTYIGHDTSGVSEYIKGGEAKRYWMKLPAPPPEVTTVSIFFTDAEPLEGIAITEK